MWTFSTATPGFHQVAFCCRFWVRVRESCLRTCGFAMYFSSTFMHESIAAAWSSDFSAPSWPPARLYSSTIFFAAS